MDKLNFLLEFFKEFWGFIVLLIPTIFAWYKWVKERKDKLHKEELERKDKEYKFEIEKLKILNKSNQANISILYNLNKTKLWNELEIMARKIFRLFGADRFLLLMAVNGKTTPDKISVFFSEEKEEFKSEIPPEEKYIQLNADPTYLRMLTRIEQFGYDLKITSEMEEGMLKDYYLEEGVEQSLVVFLKRYSLNEEDDAIIFCSIAVHKAILWASSRITSIIAFTRSKGVPILDKIVK